MIRGSPLKLLVSRPLSWGTSSDRERQTPIVTQRRWDQTRRLRLRLKNFNLENWRTLTEALQTREPSCEGDLAERCHGCHSWGRKGISDMDTCHVLGSVLGASVHDVTQTQVLGGLSRVAGAGNKPWAARPAQIGPARQDWRGASRPADRVQSLCLFPGHHGTSVGSAVTPRCVRHWGETDWASVQCFRCL